MDLAARLWFSVAQAGRPLQAGSSAVVGAPGGGGPTVRRPSIHYLGYDFPARHLSKSSPVPDMVFRSDGTFIAVRGGQDTGLRPVAPTPPPAK